MIITKQQIEQRAKEIYQKRVRLNQPGSPEEDWKKAEQQLLKELDWKELTAGWKLEPVQNVNFM